MAAQLSVAVTVGGAGTGVAQSKVKSAGTPANTGPLLSNTTMFCEAVAALPQSSVAVQVRTKVKQPVVGSPIYDWVRMAGTLLSQKSEAVTVAGAGIGVQQFSVRSAGMPAKIGGVVSVMVMVCEAVAVLPQLSVADQVRVMVMQPVTGSPMVDSCSETGTLGSQASVAETVGAVGIAAVQSKLRLAGTPTKVGVVLSKTIMVCKATAELPQSSSAVHIRMIWVMQPLESMDSISVKVKVGVSSQLSVADSIAGSGIAEQLTVTSPGAGEIMGGKLS